MKHLMILIVSLTSCSFAQYTYTIERTGAAHQAGESNHVSISVLDASDHTLYSIEKDIPFDVPFPTVHINRQTGTVVLCYGFDGFADFYNSTGQQLWSVNFFKGEEPDYERTLACSVGKESIIFLISDEQKPKAILLQYTMDGARRWERTLACKTGYTLAMSPDEQVIGTSCYESVGNAVINKTELVDGDGKGIATIDLLFRKASFSQDSRNVVFISKNEVAGYSLNTHQVSTIKSVEPASDTIFTDVLYDGNDWIIQSALAGISSRGTIQFTSPLFTTVNTSFAIEAQKRFDGLIYTASALVQDENGVHFTYDGVDRIIAPPIKQ